MRRGRKFAALPVCFSALLFLAWQGGPPLAAQDITVSSATPNSAPQGTINLNVTIAGKNFKRGAVAKFFLTGTTNPGGIAVNSTTFVGGTQLVANIDVADTATVSNFDIVVQDADGRTGKGTELFAVTPKGSNTSTDPLIRADFRDLATDRIRSDGKGLPVACGAYDYADRNDACQPGYGGVSKILSNGVYFMRTLWTLDLNPTRWLVLDFTEGLFGSACPGLDTKLTNYPGRDPAAFSPEDPNPCIDLLEVRFFLDKAYAPGSQFTPIRLIIDGPDSWNTTTGVQWNQKYELDFVNQATITLDPLDANTITVTTITGAEQAELWTLSPKTGKKQTKLGTYRMPFQVRLTKVP